MQNVLKANQNLGKVLDINLIFSKESVHATTVQDTGWNITNVYKLPSKLSLCLDQSRRCASLNSEIQNKGAMTGCPSAGRTGTGCFNRFGGLSVPWLVWYSDCCASPSKSAECTEHGLAPTYSYWTNTARRLLTLLCSLQPHLNVRSGRLQRWLLTMSGREAQPPWMFAWRRV